VKIGNRTVIRVKHWMGKGICGSMELADFAPWQCMYFTRSETVKIRVYAESPDGKYIYVTKPRIYARVIK